MGWKIIENDQSTHIRKFRDQFCKLIPKICTMHTHRPTTLHVYGHKIPYLKPNFVYYACIHFDMQSFSTLYIPLSIQIVVRPFFYHYLIAQKAILHWRIKTNSLLGLKIKVMNWSFQVLHDTPCLGSCFFLFFYIIFIWQC